MAMGKASDHLANERTFLAWVRTSVALLGFGVVIAKLSLLLAGFAAAGQAKNFPPTGHGGRSLVLGLLFSVVGTLSLVFAAIHYFQTRRMIDSDEYKPAGASIIALIVVVSLLAVASIVFLAIIARV